MTKQKGDLHFHKTTEGISQASESQDKKWKHGTLKNYLEPQVGKYVDSGRQNMLAVVDCKYAVPYFMPQKVPGFTRRRGHSKPMPCEG